MSTPPTSAMTAAVPAMMPVCARTIGSATPVVTSAAVKKFPTSIYALLKSEKLSAPARLPKSAFGSGAHANARAVSGYTPPNAGIQLDHTAHERITSRNPNASESARKISAG